LRESGAAQPETLHAEVQLLAGEQADATRVIRDLEEQVARLTEEKRALEGRLADGEAALADIRIAAAQLATRKEEFPQEESAALEEGDEVPSEHTEAEAKQEPGVTPQEAGTVPAAEPREHQPAMAGSGTPVLEIVPQEAQPTAAGGTPEPEQEDAQGAEQEQAREEEPTHADAGVADSQGGSLEPAAPQELPPDESVLLREREEEPAALGEAKEEDTRQEPIAAPPDDGAAPAVEARERPPATVQSTAAVPDVTPIEVHAATFSGVAEKVTFRRALSDMESSDEATRLEAVKTVGGICHELSVRALAVCFSREASARAREECVNALVRLGLRECLPTVERALADAAAPVRLAAVRGMYRLAGRGGAGALTRVLRDENEDVRRRAATCIGWLGDDRLARELVPLLADKSAAVRCAALEAMGNLRSQQAVAEVMELLGDPRDSVRRKAADVLCVLTGKQMTSTVPDDEDSRQRLIARWRAWWAAEPRVAGAE
jgi:HEAT repeat protein